MRIVLQTERRKSLGLVIVGERDDLNELAGRIKAWMARSRKVAPESSGGILSISGNEWHGVGQDGFDFRFNEDLTPFIQEAEKKHSALGTIGCQVAFWVPVAAFLYLVFRGLMTF
jgi:hypothetical protein